MFLKTYIVFDLDKSISFPHFYVFVVGLCQCGGRIYPPWLPYRDVSVELALNHSSLDRFGDYKDYVRLKQDKYLHGSNSSVRLGISH